MTNRRGVVTLFALMILLVAQVAPATADVVVSDEIETTTSIEPSFPQGMGFHATIPVPSSNAEVDAVQLVYRIASNPTLNLDILAPTEFSVSDGQVEASTFVDFLSGFVPVGVDLTFNWEITLGDGSIIETAEEATQWMDTRFDWESRTSDQVRLYSYGASDEFADMMLAESQATIDRLEDDYSLEDIPVVSIWVYPSYEDFQGTLQGNSRESIAAVSFPGLDTIVGIVPDGDDTEFGRVIPHEISHQVLHAATADAFSPPPLWFNEGIATHTQIGGTTHFLDMVQAAHKNETLFDIQSLDTSFPYQPQQATLAYASCWSMILYIETMWGPDGIARLIDGFGSQMSPEDAVQTALGVSLDELNDGWKAWVAIGAPTD